MQTPFNFGRTVKNDSFTNREQELKKLASNFENQINTIILSPRRWGKSSLVDKVTTQIKQKNIRVVKIDLFGIRTEEEFYNALANATIKATSGKAGEWLEMGKKFIRNVTPKFTVELGDKQSFDLSLDLDTIKKNYRELLDLPERIADEKNIKIVVCIDEFQNISTFNQTHLYRVIQELIHNAFKHSAAWHVWVQLKWEPNQLTLEVEDDGTGFHHLNEFIHRLRNKHNTLRIRSQVIGASITYHHGPKGLLAKVIFPL